jgi:nucleoside transporter
MSDTMPMSVRVRLSLMMFMQYMYFAVFFVPLAAYITNMGVKGWLYATIMSSMPLGCLISPIVCMIADRHFSSNKVLMVLNFMCAILILVATQVTSPVLLFIVLLFAMFCYMPTWSLTNAIALANCPAEKFPQIRALGSIGWVASGLFGLVAYKFLTKEVDGQIVPLTIDGTVIPLYCGAATALVAGILNLTIPNTPPPSKGKESSLMDALGLPALKLMKDFNFMIFIIISSLTMIPFVAYFSYNSQFLQQMGFTLITPTMNMGQLVEMFLMLLVPLSLAKFGVKKTMMIGLVALVVRYAAYWVGGVLDQRMFYFAGIWIHGIIFGFFFVGGQVYIDKKAPPEIRAQAQGLMGLLCFGIGWLVGNFVNAMLIEKYTVIQDSGEALTNWNPIWMITIISTVVLLGAFVVLFKDDIREGATATEEAE